jgi:hypothetical protein
VPIAGRLRGTPFAPYPMAFRAGSVGPSAPAQQRVRYVRPELRLLGRHYASQWSRHCRPRPHRQRRLRQQLLRRSAQSLELLGILRTRTPHFRIDAAGALCFFHGPLAPPGRASAMSARGPRRTALAARRLSEFRVTDFHCAPAQFSFNFRGAIIYFFRPRSINNLTASDRLTSCSAAQRSTRAMSLPESRRPIIGRTPVAGRPRFFCLTDIDLAIFYV